MVKASILNKPITIRIIQKMSLDLFISINPKHHAKGLAFINVSASPTLLFLKRSFF
jgi:hypothetical protein